MGSQVASIGDMDAICVKQPSQKEAASRIELNSSGSFIGSIA